MEIYKRNELYWGKNFQKYLENIHVAIFGLGGVGGFALEGLSRVGISNFTLVDYDKISESNINRQIIATIENIGELKTTEWIKRLKLINPNVKIKIYTEFYEENSIQFEKNPDYIVDAIDTMKSKISLLKFAKENKIKVITSLGAGNRIDGTKLKITDISEIKTNCNFTQNIIKNLKNIGIDKGISAVYSEEKPRNIEKLKTIEKINTKNGIIELTKYSPASISTVPAISGYLMANWIILDLYNNFNC